MFDVVVKPPADERRRLPTSAPCRLTPVEVRVRCGGQYHTVRLTAKGRLSLCNHTREEVRRLKTLRELGNRCRCLDLLDLWRRRSSSLPEPLRPAVRACLAVHWWRRADARQPLTPRPADVGRAVRSAVAAEVTAVHLRAAYAQCGYPSSTTGVSALHVAVGEGRDACSIVLRRPHPAVFPPTGPKHPSQKAEDLTVKVAVPRSWHLRVGDKPFAVVDGNLVIDVVTPLDVQTAAVARPTRADRTPPWWVAWFGSEDPTVGAPGVPALLVRRGTGLSVHPWPGYLVVNEGTGDYTVCWLRQGRCGRRYEDTP